MYVLFSLKVYSRDLRNVTYENNINKINKIFSDIMIMKTINNNYCDIIYKLGDFNLIIKIITKDNIYCFNARINSKKYPVA